MGGSEANRSKVIDLARCVSTAPSLSDLVHRFMDNAPNVFGTFACGFYLLGEGTRAAEIHVSGLPDRFIDLYESSGREVDPLFESMLSWHQPIDETCLFDRVDTWVKAPLFVRCSAEWDIGHYLLAPIVAGGQLIGTMNFGRHLRWRPFTFEDRMMAATLSAHVSASVATLRNRRWAPGEAEARAGLTRRELQIAELVANGLSNREIAGELWISENGIKQALKRIYRKARVTSRAALTATLLERNLTRVA